MQKQNKCMKTKLFFILLFIYCTKFEFACDNVSKGDDPNLGSEVLILKVDYTTNVFEGGQILCFPLQEEMISMYFS